MKINAKILRRKSACAGQLKLFVDTFGDATIEITEALCVEHAKKFDWGWAARALLPAPLYADYKAKLALLDADYEAKLAPLYADYKAKLAPLYADYKAKLALLDADYEAKLAPLDADYEAKRAPLYADYEAKLALLFGWLAETVT